MSSSDETLLPADPERDAAHSSSSSFGSMSETDLPRERMEQLVRTLHSENKQLKIRVLGVTELARLLQERQEKVKVLEDKNKRLEVAVVRLENRCANLEARLRSEGGGNGPLSGLKSMQPPSIPGPSRQILEALMKENSELKKTLNSMLKKGPSGYLEGVKTSQLEEVIDQQKQELEFLRSQVNMLTTTPLPPSAGGGGGGRATEREGAGPSGGSGEPGSATGDLRRQLIKLQHSLKVKDRFCSLLSDQVASLQDKMKQMKLEEEPPSTKEPPSSSQAESDASHPKVVELEGRYSAIIDSLKANLQQEREEKTAIVEKQQKDMQEAKKEKNELTRRCEDLQFHNHTLIEDKKQLQEMLDQARAEGGGAAGGGARGLEKEIRELQDSLNQKVMEHSEEIRNKDKEMQQLRMMLEDTQYKYVIAESKLSEIAKEHEQNTMELKDKIDELDGDVSAKQSEIEELRRANRQLEMDISGFRNQPVGNVDPTVRRFTSSPAERCETSQPETVYRMELVSRNMGEGEEIPQPQAQQPPPPPASTQHGGPPSSATAANPHPSSLPFRMHNPTPRHFSPSPSSASTSVGHPIPPSTSSSTHGAVTGRRSPLSPGFGHTGGGGTPRSVHYPVQPPASSHHLSAGTPMGYAPARHPHPHTLPPPAHYEGHPGHIPSQPYYAGPGGRVVGVPPSSSGIRPHRAPSDGEAQHGHPPHGYHGEGHHPHHPPRRN